MIKEFVECWNKYKVDLEEYFKNAKQEEYDTYEKIVKLLFDKVINKEETKGRLFDIDNIKVIDDGDWQGTQIFIINLKSYQPCETEYVVTNIMDHVVDAIHYKQYNLYKDIILTNYQMKSK